jgi:uncharacterized protein YdcH (DUF465 family)
METDTQELKNRLIATDEEYSRLCKEHSSYERQLEQLSNRPYLTESEKVEEINLKKRKLSLKDQMERILQKHR